VGSWRCLVVGPTARQRSVASLASRGNPDYRSKRFWEPGGGFDEGARWDANASSGARSNATRSTRSGSYGRRRSCRCRRGGSALARVRRRRAVPCCVHGRQWRIRVASTLHLSWSRRWKAVRRPARRTRRMRAQLQFRGLQRCSPTRSLAHGGRPYQRSSYPGRKLGVLGASSGSWTRRGRGGRQR